MHQVAHEPAEALANDSAHPLRALNNTPVPPPRYTSRMQKGGALLQEMRLLVQIWTDASLETNRAEVMLRNPLNKATRARVADVINRIFVPRFVHGPIKDGWKLLLPLERLGASASMRGIRASTPLFIAEIAAKDLSKGLLRVDPKG